MAVEASQKKKKHYFQTHAWAPAGSGAVTAEIVWAPNELLQPFLLGKRLTPHIFQGGKAAGAGGGTEFRCSAAWWAHQQCWGKHLQAYLEASNHMLKSLKGTSATPTLIGRLFQTQGQSLAGALYAGNHSSQLPLAVRKD